MRTIAVMNQKGGVGKTTTSVNLAAGLARAGRRVCLIDLDPQGHSSLHLGVEPVGDIPTIYQVFAGQQTMAQVRRMVASNLWVVPSNIDLAATELELADVEGRELILRQTLDAMLATEPYDYVLIDSSAVARRADCECGCARCSFRCSRTFSPAGTLEIAGDDGADHAATEPLVTRDGNHPLSL